MGTFYVLLKNDKNTHKNFKISPKNTKMPLKIQNSPKKNWNGDENASKMK